MFFRQKSGQRKHFCGNEPSTRTPTDCTTGRPAGARQGDSRVAKRAPAAIHSDSPRRGRRPFRSCTMQSRGQGPDRVGTTGWQVRLCSVSAPYPVRIRSVSGPTKIGADTEQRRARYSVSVHLGVPMAHRNAIVTDFQPLTKITLCWRKRRLQALPGAKSMGERGAKEVITSRAI